MKNIFKENGRVMKRVNQTNHCENSWSINVDNEVYWHPREKDYTIYYYINGFRIKQYKINK